MYNQNSKGRAFDLFEVLELVEKSESRKDKVAVLQKHKSQAILDYFRCVFDDKVQFSLPEGKPPYTPNVERSVPSNWNKQRSKLQYIVRGMKGDKLIPIKRETIFIGMLESVHPREAEVLVDMINKKTKKGITKKMISEAYPNLISN